MRKRSSIFSIFSVAVLTVCGAVAQDTQNRVFEISTRNTSLVYTAREDGRLVQRYYGPRIADPSRFEAMRSPDKADSRREMTWEAYPTYGLGFTNEPALSVIHHDGSLITEMALTDHRIQSDQNIVRHTFTLCDRVYDLTVELHAEAYQNEDVIALWTVIRNNEPGAVSLNNFYSSMLDLRAESYYLTHFNGTWAGEMNRTEERLGYGVKSVESRKGVRTTQTENPSFILSLGAPARENHGHCIGGALAWSGNYKLSFEVNEWDHLSVMTGMNPFMSQYKLSPGESLQTPASIYTYSTTGQGQVSRNLHDWARQYALHDGYSPRPVLLNSWEGAYFDFDENTITTMIDDAARLGVELFVLDDGWFGNKYPRNDATQGLGDWQVNRRKLPRGLEYLIDHATRRGVKFGLWIEPEMVNPRSELAECHPDWIVQSPGREKITMRNQLLLDLSNPAVQDFIWHTVDSLLTAHPRIAYIKWDANRHVEQVGSPYLAADMQTRFWIEYTRGLYGIYEKIRAKYPDLIFQACASGGGRVDYGSLRYHDEFWTSDNNDALRRIYMQYSTNLIYPANATASHISAIPGHQTGSITPLKFRFDVAMSGRLGLELQPEDIPAAEQEFAKQAIASYKEHIRDLVASGDLYAAKDKSKAVLFAYCTDFNNRGVWPTIKLHGLDPNKKYRIREINRLRPGKAFWGDGMVFQGDYLINMGVELRIARQYDSAVFLLEESDND